MFKSNQKKIREKNIRIKFQLVYREFILDRA